MVNCCQPALIGVPAALAVADCNQGNVAELRQQLGHAGGVEPSVEGGHNRDRCVPREENPVTLEVGVDDIEPAGGAPGHGDGVLHVTRNVPRVTTPPQTDVDGRY